MHAARPGRCSLVVDHLLHNEVVWSDVFHRRRYRLVFLELALRPNRYGVVFNTIIVSILRYYFLYRWISIVVVVSILGRLIDSR